MAKNVRMNIRIWRSLLFLISITVLLLSFNQFKNEKDWDVNSPLTWDDYQKPEKGTQDEKSVSHTFCGERWVYKRLDSNTYTFKFRVKCVMVKNLSWVHPDYKTPELLHHEQLHFDLSEYFARQLLVALQSANYTSNFQEEMKEVRHKVTLQRNNMQDRYDNQTKHSKNKDMQMKWDIYVKHLLNTNESIDSALTELPNKKN